MNEFFFTSESVFPKAIPTRSPTRFPTPSWTPSRPRTSIPASPPRPNVQHRPRRPGEITTGERRLHPGRPRHHPNASATTTPNTVRLQRDAPCWWPTTNRARHRPGREQGLRRHQSGHGDQGLMFGYACDETPSSCPLPIYLSHRLVERQAMLLRKDGRLPWARPTPNPGHHPLRGRQARFHRHRRSFHPALPGYQPGRPARSHHRGNHRRSFPRS